MKVTKGDIYRIPVVGFILHLIEAFFRLPRNDDRIRQLRLDVRKLQQVSAVGSASGVSPGASLQFEQFLNQHVPAFLNAVSSVPAMGHRLSVALSRIDALEKALLQAEQSIDQHVAVVANAVSSVPTLGDHLGVALSRIDTLENTLQDLQSNQQVSREAIPRIWSRLEFVRREILYEMNHGRRLSHVSAGNEPTQVVICDESKLTDARERNDIRLNLGCGHVPLEGYINVDMRALPRVDIVAPVDALPVDAGTVAEVYSAHLVEHFPQESLLRNLLPYWHDLLRPGGRFVAICPDGQAMIDAVARGEYSYQDFREVLFGAQDYDGDYHYNLLTPDSMAEHLGKSGFVNVEIVERARRNGKCFEFEIRAARSID